MFLTAALGMAMVYVSSHAGLDQEDIMKTAKGEFEVRLQPLETALKGEDGMMFGRMALDKTFKGDLAAHSVGEMLSLRTPVKTSAGYVALEHITGTLDGRSGSFVVQHFATMHDGAEQQILEVIPNSGTGELAGIRGQMKIIIKDGRHFYEFQYQLPH